VDSRPWRRLSTCEKASVIVHHALLFMPLIALVLFLLLPWPYALALYIPIATVSLLGYWKALQAQRRPPAVGKRAMIGERAEVVSSKKGELEVHYRGETWRAMSSQTLQHGQEVVIEDVEGLTLRVAPLTQPADDPAQ
jgi:membrane protein implicated in regulation of membrane protease activity